MYSTYIHSQNSTQLCIFRNVHTRITPSHNNSQFHDSQLIFPRPPYPPPVPSTEKMPRATAHATTLRSLLFLHGTAHSLRKAKLEPRDPRRGTYTIPALLPYPVASASEQVQCTTQWCQRMLAIVRTSHRGACPPQSQEYRRSISSKQRPHRHESGHTMPPQSQEYRHEGAHNAAPSSSLHIPKPPARCISQRGLQTRAC